VKKREIHIGRTYAAKVSERLVPVTILREQSYPSASDRHQGWIARNEATGREVTIRTAQRLRFEVERRASGRWGRKAPA
jgi:hypothetical protein